jgi:cytochrome c-type biogenesis protein CcmE
MKGRNNRVLVGSVIVVAALAYFGFAGFQEGKAYYKTIGELSEMGDDAYDKRIRVGGIVTAGSIKRSGGELTFQIEQDDMTLTVRYTGTTPVPDTFKDHAEALCEGTYTSDGTFEAHTIRAKCASKYEATYGKADTDA